MCKLRMRSLEQSPKEVACLATPFEVNSASCLAVGTALFNIVFKTFDHHVLFIRWNLASDLTILILIVFDGFMRR